MSASTTALTVHEAADRLASGACTSSDLVEDLLRVIAERDVDIRGYIEVDAELARREAQDADAAGAALAVGATALWVRFRRGRVASTKPG